MSTLSRPDQPPAGGPTPDALRVEHVFLGYPSPRTGEVVLAVRDLNVTVARGEFVVIVGPSGCGKTTLLEALAGLVPLHGGTIRLAGKALRGPGTDRSLVFQNASLLPWRTVRQNVEFSLQAQRRLNRPGRERVHELIRLVGLEHAERKYPHELSGGMRQRVNLARALVTAPSLLLLDEPFGALDAQTREIMQNELVRVWQAEGAEQRRTAIFVTHDVAEAVFLADRVLVFSPAPGSIRADIRIGAPRPRRAQWKRSAEFVELSDQILTALYGAAAVPGGAGTEGP
ncbi:ABC transporter ATP-binding protein [Rugosimonospora acidiphila]|uniref:ABC transporter ATP-binding protein n=1 Tax=Rugosimonospora acidiphila TaxID=556531 RepID=A0ABP9RM48_9ACTN